MAKFYIKKNGKVYMCFNISLGIYDVWIDHFQGYPTETVAIDILLQPVVCAWYIWVKLIAILQN